MKQVKREKGMMDDSPRSTPDKGQQPMFACLTPFFPMHCCMFAFRLAVLNRILSPIKQGVSRKHWYRPGSFARSGFLRLPSHAFEKSIHRYWLKFVSRALPVKCKHFTSEFPAYNQKKFYACLLQEWKRRYVFELHFQPYCTLAAVLNCY